MATKMATPCQFALVVLVIYHQIFFKFHLRTTFIKLLSKFKCGFCPLYDNQDGHQNGCQFALVATLTYLFNHGLQNGHPLSVCTFGLGHLSPDFFQVSSMDNFHQTIVQVQIRV